MSDDRRATELKVEVPSRPEEVRRAVGIVRGSRRGMCRTPPRSVRGAAAASFGPGPEMQVTGRIAVWEPPRRVVFVGGAGVGGLAFEWVVETREDATCLVRFINTGFGAGAAGEATGGGHCPLPRNRQERLARRRRRVVGVASPAPPATSVVPWPKQPHLRPATPRPAHIPASSPCTPTRRRRCRGPRRSSTPARRAEAGHGGSGLGVPHAGAPCRRAP